MNLLIAITVYLENEENCEMDILSTLICSYKNIIQLNGKHCAT